MNSDDEQNEGGEKLFGVTKGSLTKNMSMKISAIYQKKKVKIHPQDGDNSDSSSSSDSSADEKDKNEDVE